MGDYYELELDADGEVTRIYHCWWSYYEECDFATGITRKLPYLLQDRIPPF